MQGFIYANFYIGILLLSIDASLPLQRVHQAIFHEPVSETFDTSEILPEYEAVPIDQLHISKRSVDQSSQKSSLHNKSVDNIVNWIQPPDWALFTLDTPVYGIRNSSNGTAEYFVHANAMKFFNWYITLEFFYNYQKDRTKREIDEMKLKHLVKPVPIENRVDDTTGQNNESEGSSRTKRSNGDIIYPEILVIVDYDTFELHGKNVYNVLKYLHGFWNGVDLEFRSLESPKFRLNIAAILIDEYNVGLPYISSNKLNSGYLNANTVLSNSAFWLYDNLNGIIDRNKYDVAVTMTSLRLCGENVDTGPCQTKMIGQAYYGLACHVDNHDRVMFKTAIVHDGGAFDGIQIATDSLAYLFGAVDSKHPTYQCKSIDGSVMNPKELRSVVGGWTKCARDTMEQFIKTNGSCLYNEPELSKKFKTYLPGKMKDANEQCEALEGKPKPFQIDENICQSLFCYTKDSNYITTKNIGPAAPGTRCGHKKICLNLECVMEPEVDLIPKLHVVQLN